MINDLQSELKSVRLFVAVTLKDSERHRYIETLDRAIELIDRLHDLTTTYEVAQKDTVYADYADEGVDDREMRP